MAMVTQIDIAIGATPTWTTAITSIKYNRVDTQSGTTLIPTPVATGTNFSFIKSLSMDIVTVNSLNMTGLMFGKVANETTTGSKLWIVTSHASGSYVQATTPPSATSDNNVTAPTMNGATGVACPLISAPPAAYAAGPFNTTGRQGNLVEIAAGFDFTNTTAGTTTAMPTGRWQWTEG